MTNKQKTHKTTNIKKLDNSEVEIEGEIDSECLKHHRNRALEKIKKNAELPGFRKGHVPESVLIGRMGELSILEEGAELALREALPHLLSENKYDYIGAPKVSITKIALGESLGFKIKIAVMPDIELADYKKIAKEENSKEIKAAKVSEKEVADAIEQVRKSFTHKHKGEETENEDIQLPELNDDFVKKLGEFKDVSDFKIKLKEIILKEKENKSREKKRLEIADKIVAKSNIALPNVLVENELDKMQAQFGDDAERMGVKVADYLKHINKNFEELRKEWRTDAEKRAKLQLILARIAVLEKIEADKEQVEKEAAHLLEHYKEANPEKAREYLKMIMINQKVFEFLENCK